VTVEERDVVVGLDGAVEVVVVTVVGGDIAHGKYTVS